MTELWIRAKADESLFTAHTSVSVASHQPIRSSHEPVRAVLIESVNIVLLM